VVLDAESADELAEALPQPLVAPLVADDEHDEVRVCIHRSFGVELENEVIVWRQGP
jgi:hypothetical protein